MPSRHLTHLKPFSKTLKLIRPITRFFLCKSELHDFDPPWGYVGKGPYPSKSIKNAKNMLLLPPFLNLDF